MEQWSSFHCHGSLLHSVMVMVRVVAVVGVVAVTSSLRRKWTRAMVAKRLEELLQW